MLPVALCEAGSVAVVSVRFLLIAAPLRCPNSDSEPLTLNVWLPLSNVPEKLLPLSTQSGRVGLSVRRSIFLAKKSWWLLHLMLVKLWLYRGVLPPSYASRRLRWRCVCSTSPGGFEGTGPAGCSLFLRGAVSGFCSQPLSFLAVTFGSCRCWQLELSFATWRVR